MSKKNKKNTSQRIYQILMTIIAIAMILSLIAVALRF